MTPFFCATPLLIASLVLLHTNARATPPESLPLPSQPPAPISPAPTVPEDDATPAPPAPAPTPPAPAASPIPAPTDTTTPAGPPEAAILQALLAGDALQAAASFAAPLVPPPPNPPLDQALAHGASIPTVIALLDHLPATSPWLPHAATAALDRACHHTLRLCDQALHALDRTQARGWIPTPELTAAQAQFATLRAGFTPASPARPERIGVLLPRSGPLAWIGTSAQEVLDLAVETEGGGVSLILRDTAGEPDRARTEAQALIRDERVVGLLGPVGRLTSAAVAETARFLEVPTVILASTLEPPASPQADLGAILKVRASPTELAHALATAGRAGLELTRVAILAPATAGEEVPAFSGAWTALGGELTREVRYPEDPKAFKAAICELLQLPRCTRPPKRAPRLDFDALYWPAPAAEVRRLLPQLAAWGFRPRRLPGGPGVQLLGAPSWAQPTLIDQTQNLTNNAVFTSSWDDSSDSSSEFVRRFFARYGRRPTVFQAEVWDAAHLLFRAVAESWARDAHTSPREALAQALLRPRTEPGVTGPLVITPPTAELPSPLAPRTHLLTVDGPTIRTRLSEEEERALRAPPPTPPEGR